jgi:arginine utilization regulatory protein
LKKNIRKLAPQESNILIYGETGTGKEILAQSIHGLSRRRHKPLVVLNCAAMPESLVESILFGTVAGAYTGATNHKGLLGSRQRRHPVPG